MVAEYRYRRIFGMSHEEFLSEPRALIEWMVHIDSVFPRSGFG